MLTDQRPFDRLLLIRWIGLELDSRRPVECARDYDSDKQEDKTS